MGLKTLLITKSYPPVVGGSAYLLYELTRHFPEDELIVVHGINDPPINSDQLLPFKRKQVLFFSSGKNTLRINRYLPTLYILMIRRRIRQMIKAHKPDRIYLHYPNGAFNVAGYLEAQRAKIPYIFYQDILWEERETGAELDLAKKFESKVVKGAKSCIAITEFAAEHQFKKHGKPFITIPHTLSEVDIPNGVKEVQNKVPKIHFAGGIYPQMNQDSVERLIEAVKLTGREIEFEFCSPDVPNSLANETITWKYLSKSELILAQQSCDILFLPQAFESNKMQMIEHNFPTKTMEYLCSGRPILVHSPKNSYLSNLCSTEGFGKLVDLPNTQDLADAIIEILDSRELQHKLVQGAQSLALKRLSKDWYNLLRQELEKN